MIFCWTTSIFIHKTLYVIATNQSQSNLACTYKPLDVYVCVCPCVCPAQCNCRLWINRPEETYSPNTLTWCPLHYLWYFKHYFKSLQNSITSKPHIIQSMTWLWRWYLGGTRDQKTANNVLVWKMSSDICSIWDSI